MYFKRFAENLEQPSQPPRLLHYQAPVDARESIRKHGLDCATFFSSKPQPAPGFDVWEADTQGMELEEGWTATPDDGGNIWITRSSVPPSRLRLVHLAENRQLGRPLPEVDPAHYGHRNAKVTIYQVTTDDTAFKARDSVTISYKFARDHANRTAEDEPVHVLSACVLASEVFEAYNPGEFFYDGPETPGRPILEVQATVLESNFPAGSQEDEVVEKTLEMARSVVEEGENSYFSSNKVAIGDVIDVVAIRFGYSVDEVKKILWAAHKQGQITLSRMDYREGLTARQREVIEHGSIKLSPTATFELIRLDVSPRVRQPASEVFEASVNLQGEYWITEDGDVYYADGDIGDYNHEAHVIETIQSQLADEFNVRADPPYDWDEVKKQFVQEILDSADESQREKWKEIGEYDPDELIELYLTQEGHQNAQEVLSLANGMGDASGYAIKNWGWKRVAGMSVETWTLTPQDMQAIGRGMDEIIEQEDLIEDVPDEQIEIDVSVYRQGNRIDATLAELKRGQLGNLSQPIPNSAYTSDDLSHSARQQTRDIEIASMHPAYWPNQPPHRNPYGRKGVNPFGDWLVRRGKRLTEAGGPDLSYLLGKPGEIPQIGPESVTRATTDGVSVYRSPHGSVRYVYMQEGRPVAALQVVTMDNESASIANVWTEPDHRRQGLAAELLNTAKKDFTTVQHHDDVTDTELSDDGEQWKSSFGESFLGALRESRKQKTKARKKQDQKDSWACCIIAQTAPSFEGVKSEMKKRGYSLTKEEYESVCKRMFKKIL